jgi:hypothetical protein
MINDRAAALITVGPVDPESESWESRNAAESIANNDFLTKLDRTEDCKTYVDFVGLVEGRFEGVGHNLVTVGCLQN